MLPLEKEIFLFYVANCLLLLKRVCTVLMKCILRNVHHRIISSLYLFGEERRGFSDMEVAQSRELFFANTVAMARECLVLLYGI